jgi:hypothetical protein
MGFAVGATSAPAPRSAFWERGALRAVPSPGAPVHSGSSAAGLGSWPRPRNLSAARRFILLRPWPEAALTGSIQRRSAGWWKRLADRPVLAPQAN